MQLRGQEPALLQPPPVLRRWTCEQALFPPAFLKVFPPFLMLLTPSPARASWLGCQHLLQALCVDFLCWALLLQTCPQPTLTAYPDAEALSSLCAPTALSSETAPV